MLAGESARRRWRVSFDLVIRGGTVVDGSGLGGYRADVGIVGDRIALVGRIKEQGAREIDADGLVVTPGFIDAHTHMDAQIFWDRQGSNSCWHGVTTVVMGNCGFTLAPVHSDARALVVRNLERAEDMDPNVLAAGIEWSWETFPEYLETIDKLPKAINYASNIGHSALRTWAMGDRAFTEAATADDLALMTSQLDAALRAGAIGFTTSQSQHHETSDDRPVASRLADWHEVRALAQTMSDFGAGIYEGVDLPLGDATDDADRERLRWERTRELTVELGVPFTEGPARDRSRRPRPARDLRPHRRRGRAHDRPGALPRHQRAAVVPHPPAVRRARRVAGDPRALARGAAARAARPVGAREARRRGDARRLHEVAGDRRDAAQARLGRHPRLRARPAAEPDAPRARGRAQHHARRRDDRPRARHQLRAALHPAEPVPAGPRRAHEGAAPPAHGDDVLRLRRAHEPDLRLVDPHPPARLLGAGAGRVHPRRGRAHDHARARARVGLRRPRACSARAWPPT